MAYPLDTLRQALMLEPEHAKDVAPRDGFWAGAGVNVARATAAVMVSMVASSLLRKSKP